MQGVFISLLNPVLALIFAGLFLTLWLQQKQTRRFSVLLFSVGYFTYAISFTLQFLPWPFGQAGNALLSDLFMTCSFVAIIHGILRRRDRPTPFLALGVIAAGGFTALAWFVFGQPDMTGRIYAINFCFGAMMILASAKIRRFENRMPIENVLLAVTSMIGIYTFVRTVGVSIAEGHLITRAQYVGSFTWLMLNFSAAFFALVFALTLLSMVVLDRIQDLRLESTTDLLSGLRNRRGFEMQARRMVDHADRLGVPTVLLICDLDHFKTVNDRFGHVCGDAVIAAFANCLGGAAGSAHLAARIGGEEFAVVLTGANLKTGRLFAEAVRTACSTLAVDGLPDDYSVTASFGLAETRAGEDLTSLMRRADAALYDAKRRGRDRVRSAANSSRDGAQADGGSDAALLRWPATG